MTKSQMGAVAVVALLVGSMVGAGVAMVAMPDDGPADQQAPDDDPTVLEPTDNGSGPADSDAASGIAQFESNAAFEQYVQQGQAMGGGYAGVGMAAGDGGAAVERSVEVTTDQAVAETSVSYQSSGSDGSTERHSSTNVQVSGIDEPDILKTTGDHLYYSSQPRRYFVEPMVREDGDEPIRPPTGETHVFDTTAPADPREITGINASGKLLLSGDRLVVFEGDRLRGYDVSDPENPEAVWTRAVNASVETARLANGSVYLVTRSRVSPGTPCPVEPLGGPGAAIHCTDIYHPRQQVAVDVTYSAFVLDPESGDVEDSVSFVGTRERSAIYMSGNALYVTYTERADRGELLIDAVLSAEQDVPDWVADRLREIRSYNLSARSTETEVTTTVQQWLGSLSTDERETVSERMGETVRDYVREHRRDLVTTGIVRVSTADGLSVDSVGEVPGEPLNQFSMDEYNGTLRIATTIPRQLGTDSVNDLYTLDAESLERTGAVTGMGVDERVYSVRYVDETAYVVTFRRIDPFHVVDLSDPANPEEVGELELPGYSSYLHPVDENHVLGIGEEDGTVKTVLFDVSDPSDPTIDDTYFPDARWSAIAQSHHAFLMDARHGVFFLPGGEQGYIVDYTDGDLSLETSVETEGQTKRAAYIDDYLYVFSDSELVVLDETDWSTETRLTFEK